MTSVTASEIQKNFGRYKEIAQREPITITSNGRESVVLISYSEFSDFLEFKKSRFAFQGEVSRDFESEVNAFIDENEQILDGLAK